MCLFHALKIFAIFLAICQAKRDFTIEILAANLTNLDARLVKSLNFDVFNRKTVYVDFTLNYELQEFDLKLKFDLVKKDNRSISLFNNQLNGCESIKGAQKSAFLKIILREVLRVTNLPRKCPLLANTQYFFKNYTLRDDDYPIHTPQMEWKINADFIVGKKIKAIGFLMGRVRKV